MVGSQACKPSINTEYDKVAKKTFAFVARLKIFLINTLFSSACYLALLSVFNVLLFILSFGRCLTVYHRRAWAAASSLKYLIHLSFICWKAWEPAVAKSNLRTHNTGFTAYFVICYCRCLLTQAPVCACVGWLHLIGGLSSMVLNWTLLFYWGTGWALLFSFKFVVNGIQLLLSGFDLLSWKLIVRCSQTAGETGVSLLNAHETKRSTEFCGFKVTTLDITNKRDSHLFSFETCSYSCHSEHCDYNSWTSWHWGVDILRLHLSPCASSCSGRAPPSGLKWCLKAEAPLPVFGKWPLILFALVTSSICSVGSLKIKAALFPQVWDGLSDPVWGLCKC